MRDLLLIKPISNYNLQHTPPLGLGFISSYVKKNGFTARIFDCNVLRVSPEHLPEHLSLKEYRLIGLQAFDMDLHEVKKYLRVLHKEAPNVPIIIGGPAPSSNPAFVFKFLKEADFLVIGEGEIAVTKVLQLIHAGNMDRVFLQKVPNLAWREGDEIRMTDHEYIPDLDAIGSPDWDELNPNLYGNDVHGFFYRNALFF